MSNKRHNKTTIRVGVCVRSRVINVTARSRVKFRARFRVSVKVSAIGRRLG
jgi:hypothetical protein